MSSLSPILDLRGQRSGLSQVPARLLTVLAWGASLTLLGAPIGHALPRLALAGALGAPALLLPGRRSRPRPPVIAPADLERGTAARAFGLEEAELFRARHARCLTVHHDPGGRIVALQLPEPAPVRLLPDRDAHPVG